MATLKRIILFWMISFFLSMALFSCIEDNVTDIRWDDEDHWKPDLSLPLGAGSVDINNYFERYSELGNIPGDTFPVYFEDSLYRLNDDQIATKDSLNYSLADQINSYRYIEFMNIQFYVWNGYPTESRVQVYFREGSNPIDSLFDAPKVIENAALDEEGRVKDPQKQEFDVTCNQETIENIYNGDNVLVKSCILVIGEDLNSIRFYSDYEIRIEAAAHIKLNLRPSDLGY